MAQHVRKNCKSLDYVTEVRCSIIDVLGQKFNSKKGCWHHSPTILAQFLSHLSFKILKVPLLVSLVQERACVDWKDREKGSNVEKRPIFSGRGRRGMMAEWWRDPAHKSAFKEHEMCSRFQSIFRCLACIRRHPLLAIFITLTLISFELEVYVIVGLNSWARVREKRA